MEYLRQPIKGLVAPICTACNTEMAWSRSMLIAAEQAIMHVFTCPKCDSVAETKTPVKTPEK
jgi:formate dehydrogenase maturation protein FdhE